MNTIAFTKRWHSQRWAGILSEISEKNIHVLSSNALQFYFGTIVKKRAYELTPELAATYSKYTLVNENDIIINGLNLNYDFVSQRIGMVKEPGIITSAYISLRVNCGYNPKFYCYLLKAMDAQKWFHGMGTGIRLTLSYKDLRNISLPVPPRTEQDQIVRFLDWKVSVINRLINLKKKEIGEILHLRQNAITKKLSGEEVWLKRLLLKPMQYGANSSGTELNPNLPRYIRITDIDSMGNLKDEGAKSIELSEAEPYILQQGDILLARSGATVGKAFMYKREHGYCAYAGYLIRVKLTPKLIIPEYFMYFTNSSIYANWKDRTFIQATIQNISAERYGRLPVPLPSLDVQMETIDILNDICGKIDALVMNYRKEIRVLEEYRTRLISDVVTGKIDVRGIEVPEFEYVEETEDDTDEELDEKSVENEEEK